MPVHRAALQGVCGLLMFGLVASATMDASAQNLTLTNIHGSDSNSAQALANALKGDGIQAFTNVTFVGVVGTGITKGGTSSSGGVMTGGENIVGIDKGIVLSSGGIFNAPGPNTSASITQTNNTGEDPHLTALIGVSTQDKTILEFDFIPTYPTIAFRYVFSSDEFNEYANDIYNDVFGFFVNGTTPAHNIARIPGTASPVSINTVNGGNPLGTNPKNAQYFVNNSPQAFNIEMDGMTVVLTAQAAVNPGVVNHIKIAIADVGDTLYDSNVFIEKSSFVSGTPPLAANDSYKTPGNTTLTVLDSGVLANDSDVDHNIERAQVVVGPTHGTLDMNDGGGFTYVPTTGYSGFDTFTYLGIDQDNIQSTVATVTIEVGASNAIPTTADSTISISKNSVTSLSLANFVFNDADVGNAMTAIKVQSFTMPTGATFQSEEADIVANQVIYATTIQNDGLKFKPAPGQFGPAYATLVYQVSDGVDFSLPKTLTIDVNNISPEIAVTGNDTDIATDSPTASLTNYTDFGGTLTANGTINRTFTIANVGTSPLAVENVSISGPDSADFVVTIQPDKTVGIGNLTTFSVQFDPSADGIRTAFINFNNSDGDESPFNFAIQGEGQNPLPVVTFVAPIGGGTTGGNTVVLTGSKFTGASAVTMGGTPVTSFTVNSDTQITAVAPAHAAGVVNVAVTIPAGTGTGYSLYTYATGPEITIDQPAGSNFNDADTKGFDSVIVGGSKTLTFTVNSIGSTDLTLGAITKNGAHPADFVVGAPVSTTLATGTSTTFTVTFTPGAAGARSAAIHIANNDANENPFDINLTGEGIISSPVSFSAATYTVNQGATSATLTITRPDATLADSVTINTDNGTTSTIPPFSIASAPADYTDLAGAATTVNFGIGETSKTVVVTLIPKTGTSIPNKRFTATISSPTTGILGAITTATVRILANDTVNPTLTITAPAASVTSISAAPPYLLKGVVGDAKGVDRVVVVLNGGAPVNAVIGTATLNTSMPYSLNITPVAGTNTLTVTAYDLRGNSKVVTRTFGYVRRYILTLQRTPPSGSTPDDSGIITLLATPAANATGQVPDPTDSNLKQSSVLSGTPVKLTASPHTGYIFSHWTGIPSGGAALGNVLTFTMPSADVPAVSAVFVENTFAGPVGSGNNFYGFIHPQGAAPSNNATEGYVNGTLNTSTGLFTGKVLIDGENEAFTSYFYGDGTALFTVGATKTYDFVFGSKTLRLAYSANVVTATVTDGSVTSSGTLARAIYSATNKVPAALLNTKVPVTATANNQGFFTAGIIPPSTPSSTYPAGDGFATLTLTDAGVVTLTGTLADGSTLTGSFGVLAGNTCPIFVQLATPGNAAILGGSISGTLTFDASQTDSDVSATNLVWFRPTVTAVTTPAAAALATNLYTDGWPTGISVSAVGALYDKSATVQDGLAMAAADPTNGNGRLVFADGKLTSSVTKTNFNITGSTFAKIPTTDASYALVVTPSTGSFTGSFTPNWASPSATKPTFKGIMVQKGANTAGFGFFHSNAVGDLDPESGGVTLDAQ